MRSGCVGGAYLAQLHRPHRHTAQLHALQQPQRRLRLPCFLAHTQHAGSARPCSTPCLPPIYRLPSPYMPPIYPLSTPYLPSTCPLPTPIYPHLPRHVMR